MVPWEECDLQSVFPLEKSSRAGVVMDRDGMPQLFVFSTSALLDVLSAIDEKLVDKLSDEDYHSKDVNAAGWAIDEIESRLPLNPEFVQTLKDAVEEAKSKGWIPLKEMENEFGLAS